MSKDTVSGRIKSSISFLTIVIITLVVPWLFIINKLFLVICGVISILEIYLAYKSPSRIHQLNDQTVHQIAFSEIAIICGGVLAYLTLTREQAILLQISVITCDTMAYVTGKLFGRKFIRSKPFPGVSPNKSHEGVIGGTAAAALVALGVSLWQSHLGNSITIFNYLVIALVGALTVIGDLLGSITKRKLAIKDSNACTYDHWLLQYPERLMSGFGGYLDRLDSIFFASLAVVIFYRFST